MADAKSDFEKRVHAAYAKYGPLAKTYYYTFRRTSVTRGGTPALLFLGNHSSGKSSLINWVLGGDAVQDVGLAPTDDGFTVIIHGETEEDVCGPAAISRLPLEFRPLETFGGTFLQHLKVKVRRRDVLRGVSLIDSPGMIDSAEGGVSRTYDFEGVVKSLADLSDMVFFLLDPDKPGTTGETVNVFARCLVGSEFKLRVMLNKCDAFTSMYDFARTYGTACWNLARVLHTKDLPKIATIYSGTERASEPGGLDFTDFNRHRGEFLDVVRNAAERRYDNVFSQALSDFLCLSVRMCVVNAAARHLAGFHAAFGAMGGLVLAVVGFAARHVLLARFGFGEIAADIVAGLVVALGVIVAVAAARLAEKFQRAATAERVDEFFAREYRPRLVVGVHDNLNQYWESVRAETAEIIRAAPLKLPIFGEVKRRRLEAAVEGLSKSFHEA